MLTFMAATTTTAGGHLRRARERAGLTRVELAALAGCSLSQLANLEQGAAPKRSRVLTAALAALARISENDDDPDLTPGRVETSARYRRHDEA
jgi:transcriptional regulator with XRE-family HTH domain